MGQTEIVAWLREMALSSKTKGRYFYAKEIEAALVERGVPVLKIRSQLNALYVYKYLDIKLGKGFTRRYRLRKQYVSEEAINL